MSINRKILNKAGSILFAVIFILLISPKNGVAQFVQNNSRSLFSDVKAFRAGDALMILIMEETQANNGATTKDSRSSELSGGLEAGAGGSSFGADVTLGTGNKFNGEGQTTRQEKIKSRLTAKVTAVDSTGNLQIEGKRTTKINGETQTIILKGIVRQVDISPDNSVYSYNIMDLSLTIDGLGTVTDAQEPGFITKFLRFLF